MNVPMEEKACIRISANPSQIQQSKQQLKLHQASFSSLTCLLALAGNEARLKILYLLKREAELCPCDLSDILQMSAPAISQHLRKLKDAHLIRSRKAGQLVYYSLKEKHVPVISFLLSSMLEEKASMGV